jgi:membrane-associated phospholipid phosphatase
MPRSKVRDAAICALNMWGYTAAYKMPNDDPDALRARVHVRYPIVIDRVLGLGRLPTERLQRRFATPGGVSRAERVLTWCHWLWFAVPHLSVIYVWFRRPDRFGAAAARMYAVFDLGVVVYWLLPTAPPWWAASHGHLGEGDPLPVRRMMSEYGERFWGESWNDLYDVLGGNPLAAMPSQHFATSLMGARLLSEVGPMSGAVGWAYTAALGLALVYLGEHYAIDLIAGATLAEAVRLGAKPAAGAARLVERTLQTLEACATG